MPNKSILDEQKYFGESNEKLNDFLHCRKRLLFPKHAQIASETKTKQCPLDNSVAFLITVLFKRKDFRCFCRH